MKAIFTSFTAILLSLTLLGENLNPAKSAEEYEAQAQELHHNYQFEQAVSLYHKALQQTTDSAKIVELQTRILNCENGQSMLEYIVRPDVLDSKELEIGDFYLYISDFEEKSWIPLPNPLNKSSVRHPYYSAVYLPENTNKIIFSAPDESGAWNLYTSERINNTFWSAPQILSENTTSSGDEIYPLLSPDGKTLYFASNGFAGIGGYDLFKSEWDSENGEWGIPENLGFPYSSTHNDLIYHNTFDGNYTLIFSDRNSQSGEIGGYVLQAITTPVKTALQPDESAAEIASFKIAKSAMEETPVADKPIIDSALLQTYNNYSVLINKIKVLQQDYREKREKLAESRGLYEKAGENDKEFLKEIIEDIEKGSSSIKQELDKLTKEVHKLEMEFLSKGIIIHDMEQEETSETDDAASSTYKFEKKEMGEIPYMEVEIPKPKFDYSFKVLKEGQFALDNTLPEGLVYQIQIAVLSSKAKTKELKGLSPVFVKKLSSGKYLHTVGLFRTHAEALSNLNTVRKRGFSSAFIVAFNNGESISVKKAKNIGKNQNRSNGYSVILNGYEEGLPSSVITIIQQTCKKDISKGTQGDNIIYMVGPFTKKEDAEYLIKTLSDLGVENITLNTL